MALKATIFKAELQIANMDRTYYQDHTLTIARHPSETDDESDLWQKDLTRAVEIWIDVGQSDEKRVRRACGRAPQVFVYAYGGRVVRARGLPQQPADSSPEAKRLSSLYRRILDHGVLLASGGLGCVSTTIGETDLEYFMEILAGCLAENN